MPLYCRECLRAVRTSIRLRILTTCHFGFTVVSCSIIQTCSDVGHLKHYMQICQITVHLAFLQLEELPIQLIQLHYLSLQA
jgi:hypothetical protein